MNQFVNIVMCCCKNCCCKRMSILHRNSGSLKEIQKTKQINQSPDEQKKHGAFIFYNYGDYERNK